LGVDHPDVLRRLITFYGAENVNVFIGAFASHVGQNRKQGQRRQTFSQFLREVAPYRTEDELAAYLRKSGFLVASMSFRQQHNHEFVQVFNPLMLGYEKDKAGILGQKEKILVEHEAAQLVQLQLDQASGARSVFVSADRRMRRVMLSAGDLRQFVGMALPPEGFVGLLDIMVGLKTDRRGLTRLVWAAPRRDADQAIRDYLVARALDQTKAALARAMPEVIDQVVADGKRELEAQGVDWSAANEVEDVARTAKFMDRLEETFFETMRWWIEREERESAQHSSVGKARST
jgi:hypothetical protein